MVVVIGTVFGYIFYDRISKDSQTKAFLSSMKAPPVTVATMTVDDTVWYPALSAIGSLSPVNGVDVTVEIPGMTSEIFFRSGQVVEKGEILVTLDARSDMALLESLTASEKLAHLQLERKIKLVEKKMTPQSELDASEAEYKRIRAQVKNQEILIDKKEIKAPFSGILGIRKINVGQYLSPGTPIVSLQTIDPIYADFTIPQQRLKDIHEGQPLEFHVDSWNDLAFKGQITAIEPAIDPMTRNFSLRATLDNTEKKLRPGMFGTVTINLPESRQVIAVPQTAINYNPYGDIIFIADGSEKDDQGNPLITAQRRFVVTGERRGDQVAITEGLRSGEQIIVMGHHKVKDGSTLIINNEVLPDNDPDPDLIDQ
jgi:membrane fusion protein (multidrug efflux system)